MLKAVLVRGSLLTLALASVLAACGKANKNKPGSSDLEAVEDKGSEKFNLAKFLRENPKSAAIKPQIAPADAYIFFGSKEKFRVETNLSLNTQGDQSYMFGAPRAVSANYWLEGYVFSKRIGSGDRGFIIDVGATGDLGAPAMEAYVRFLGADKFRGKVETTVEKTFVRDLNLDTVYYPIPLLGVKVGGNIGGELGLKAIPSVKGPSAMSVTFVPKASVNAGLSGGVEVLKFAEAKVKGSVTLMMLEIAGIADLGVVKEANYAYGHTGVDGGLLESLEGKVEILANATVKGVLPGGIDGKLWEALLGAVGVENTGWEWKHTVWNPKPLIEKDLPSYGNSFMKFSKIPESLADCKSEVALIGTSLDKHMANIKEQNAEAKGIELALVTQSQTYLTEVKTKANEYCKQY